ncbi:hypothetical protein K435DRAFT_785844 [Dendrothele bispora CBS 962.96]|uniref:Uncharacterized protein n=1 Tax=Dendrothele bispora (strain CBS 962.96) TaxID=1314807 RepID=A0A4S8KUA7_DENBC|nr:hypothetical protein K435DRAFT_785844 [Dendrothele bispora CBS 962.96]
MLGTLSSTRLNLIVFVSLSVNFPNLLLALLLALNPLRRPLCRFLFPRIMLGYLLN